jgi:beta-glucanase (GH16 family)
MRISPRSIKTVAALLVASATLTATQQSATAVVPTQTKKLLWSVEFNGKAGKKPSDFGFKYDYGYANGWGNSEVQYYTSRPGNSATDGKGKLVFTAKRMAFEDPLNVRFCGLGCEYTSARIKTEGKLSFRYGRMEARIKVASGKGTWPAFWMLGTDIGRNPWPNSGEIDIMEAKGIMPTMLWGTVHGPGYSGGGGISNTYLKESPLADSYHVYAIEWQPNSIKWFIDGQQFGSITPAQLNGNKWVFNKH